MVVCFGEFKGRTFEYVRDHARRDWILWFLAHDIVSGTYLRKYLLHYFDVLRCGNDDILLSRPNGVHLLQKRHIADLGDPPQGVVLLSVDGPDRSPGSGSAARDAGPAQPDPEPVAPTQDYSYLEQKRPRSPSQPPSGSATRASHVDTVDVDIAQDIPVTANATDDTVTAEMCCKYWMTGRGCKNLWAFRCAFAHPIKKDGEDYLSRNVCRNFMRGKCADQQYCKRIHARSIPHAKQVLFDILNHNVPQVSRAAAQQTPHIATFSDVLVSAIRSVPTHEQELFLHNVCHTLQDSFCFQHPIVRGYIDDVIVQVTNAFQVPDDDPSI